MNPRSDRLNGAGCCASHRFLYKQHQYSQWRHPDIQQQRPLIHHHPTIIGIYHRKTKVVAEGMKSLKKREFMAELEGIQVNKQSHRMKQEKRLSPYISVSRSGWINNYWISGGLHVFEYPLYPLRYLRIRSKHVIRTLLHFWFKILRFHRTSNGELLRFHD